MAFNKQKVACTDTPWAKKEEFFQKILKDLTKEPLFYHGQMLCIPNLSQSLDIVQNSDGGNAVLDKINLVFYF